MLATHGNWSCLMLTLRFQLQQDLEAGGTMTMDYVLHALKLDYIKLLFNYKTMVHFQDLT